MSEVRFWIPCVPPKTTHQAKKIRRFGPGGKFTRIGDTSQLEDAKSTLESLLMPHQIAAPVTGAVSLSLEFVWPWRASESKRVRALGQIPHVSRPDCSNLAKTLEDRLVALRFIEDDNAVSRLTVTKFWGDSPGIEVRITQFLKEG